MKIAIAGTAILAVLALAGCSAAGDTQQAASEPHTSVPTSHEPMFTADPTPTETTVTETETPEPVDPDVVWATGYRSSGAMRTLHTAVRNVNKTVGYLDAYNMSAASISALTVSVDFDTVVVQAKGVPGWQKSPLAQQSIDTFVGCSTAWSDAADALGGIDPAAVNQATGKIQTCTADLHRTNLHIERVSNR